MKMWRARVIALAVVALLGLGVWWAYGNDARSTAQFEKQMSACTAACAQLKTATAQLDRELASLPTTPSTTTVSLSRATATFDTTMANSYRVLDEWLQLRLLGEAYGDALPAGADCLLTYKGECYT